MSNSLAIATCTVTLKTILDGALKASPAALTGDGQIEVKTGRPTPDGKELPNKGVNLFLYQVTPSPALRNIELPVRRPDGGLMSRPQAAFDLHYLISFHGDDSTLQPQRLMGIVLRTLHARPLLSRQAIEKTIDTLKTDNQFKFLQGSDLASAFETVRLTPMTLTLEEMSKIWSVFFQTPYRLSIAYQVGPLLIEPDDTPAAVLPVASRVVVAGTGGGAVITRVVAAEGAGLPVTSGGVLLMEGRGLAGATLARIDAISVTPLMVSDDLVRVRLPDSLVPGTHSVSLTYPNGAEANPAAFVLHPRLLAVAKTGVTSTGVGPNIAYSAQLDLTFDAPVGRDQHVSLALSAVPPAPARLSFDAAPRPHGPTDPKVTHVVRVRVERVPPGTYVVAPRIEGAAALPKVGDTALPVVAFP